MNYNYNYGHIICSTPHGDLYWLFDSGEEHYGITESGHHYRRNDTYGYYYIRQFNLTFNAQNMTKSKWRNLEAAVVQNNINIFKEKVTIDKSFGKALSLAIADILIGNACCCSTESMKDIENRMNTSFDNYLNKAKKELGRGYENISK